MSQHDPTGTPVGTFEGQAGDQLQRMDGMVDVSVAEAGYDERTDEELIEVTFRMDQPVDEQRLSVTFPEHGVDKLIQELVSKS